jgi:hypothetical protein
MTRDPIEFMQRLEEARARDRERTENDGWAWKRNISLYRNPEFLCPRCHTWDETGLTWLVDGNRYQVLGVWHLDGRSAYSSFSYIHPHVSGSNICRGNAGSAEAALFASIHPDNPYHDINTWLKEVGHADKCSYFPKMKCAWCDKERAYLNMVIFGGTQLRTCEKECFQKASEIRCYGCFQERDTSMDYRRDNLCEKCFDQSGYSCGVCQERWATSKTRKFRDMRVCPECYENRKKRCGGCSKWFLIKDMDTNGRCLLSCKKVFCNYCGGPSTVGEIDSQRYCPKCHEATNRICPRCNTNKATAKGWCNECAYTCGCDCECDEEVEYEGYRCNACEEGEHNDD